MTPIVRFAPSPTGLLHVGNARAALINALFALRHGGRYLLRYDDTDRERSREEYSRAIAEDLRWMEIGWDDTFRQSDRLALYEEKAEHLRATGRLYPCYETTDELEYKRRRQLKNKQPPIYDRAALRLSAAERGRFEAEGRRPHWRFLMKEGEVAWTDLVRGLVSFQAEKLSDPVLIRADGTFLYMLPSMIDDAEAGITHVIRGEDHVVNTAAQIQMFEALGAAPPIFAHLPLMTDMGGRNLSKRLGSLSVQALRASGIEAMALNGWLARLGTGDAPDVRLTLGELAADFDISRFGRATPKFDEAQLQHFNERFLHLSPFSSVRGKLAAMGLDPVDDTFWEAIRPNLHQLSEALHWHAVCFGSIDPVISDRDFVSHAARLLPAEPWDAETWEAWTRAVKDATGRRGKELFQPLRLALTGSSHGPELKALLPIIGRAKAERRLSAGS